MLAQGDESAFTELYNRFWQKLFSIAYKRLNEMQVAEDIVHDVFVMLWANREKIKIDALENYLATATKYMVLLNVKRRERDRNYYSRSLPHTALFDLPIETSLHYKRVLEIIKNEVEALPEKCRLIFNYSRNEGMPVREIARQLNISPKTVENQINKALRQLKIATKALSAFFIFVH